MKYKVVLVLDTWNEVKDLLTEDAFGNCIVKAITQTDIKELKEDTRQVNVEKIIMEDYYSD